MLNEFNDILKIDDVSKALCFNRQKIYSLTKDGSLKCFKVGKSIRILKSDLIEFINKNIK